MKEFPWSAVGDLKRDLVGWDLCCRPSNANRGLGLENFVSKNIALEAKTKLFRSFIIKAPSYSEIRCDTTQTHGVIWWLFSVQSTLLKRSSARCFKGATIYAEGFRNIAIFLVFCFSITFYFQLLGMNYPYLTFTY